MRSRSPALQHSFAITCDKLRADTDDSWMALMGSSRAIQLEEFETLCDTGRLLDEGETLGDFIASDPGSGFYATQDGAGRPVYFLQTRGFEFFFTLDGRPPAACSPSPLDIMLFVELGRDALATALLGANDARLNGALSLEQEEGRVSGARLITGDSHARLILEDENGPAAGLRLSQGEVDQIYVRHDRRREGLATQLLQIAQEQFGVVQLSMSRTADGAALAAAIEDHDLQNEYGPDGP